MPIIRISHAASYEPQTNERIISAVSNAYADVVGIHLDKVSVLVEEFPRDRWGSSGTSLAQRDAALVSQDAR